MNNQQPLSCRLKRIPNMRGKRPPRDCETIWGKEKWDVSEESTLSSRPRKTMHITSWERWDNKGKVHKLLWINWLGPLWPTCFGSITTHSQSDTNNQLKKRMSWELLQLQCLVVIQQLKLSINVINFFSPSHANAACVFLSYTEY